MKPSLLAICGGGGGGGASNEVYEAKILQMCAYWNEGWENLIILVEKDGKKGQFEDKENEAMWRELQRLLS